MSKIFTIVISYNGMRWYDRCLGSLINSDYPLEVIVIDNSSSDNSVRYIKETFPSITVIENNANLGFAKANNIGIKYAIEHGADFVFLLNQDAWVEKNTITTLLQTFIDNKKVGIASPIHLNGSYSGMDTAFGSCLPVECLSDLYLRREIPYYDVPFVNAASWLISADCINTVGGFDTLLFHHFGEDNNYCQRVLYHGFRIIINMHCTICHDRESRKNSIGINPNWDKENEWITQKVELGDINKSFDFSLLIKKAKRKRIHSILLFHLSLTKAYDSMINNYKLIIESRRINKQKGQHWLNEYRAHE